MTRTCKGRFAGGRTPIRLPSRREFAVLRVDAGDGFTAHIGAFERYREGPQSAAAPDS
jgi:hypothetical protein